MFSVQEEAKTLAGSEGEEESSGPEGGGENGRSRCLRAEPDFRESKDGKRLGKRLGNREVLLMIHLKFQRAQRVPDGPRRQSRRVFGN